MTGRRKARAGGLSPRDRALLELAAAVALGPADKVGMAFQDFIDLGGRRAGVRALFALSSAFCGWPTCLAAFRQIEARLGQAPLPRDSTPTRAQARREGRRNLRAVYGARASRILERVRGYDPALARLLLEAPYGEIYGRRSLTLTQKELVACLFLTLQGRRRELHGHLLGALRVGGRADEIAETLEIAREALQAATPPGPERALEALLLFRKIGTPHERDPKA